MWPCSSFCCGIKNAIYIHNFSDKARWFQFCGPQFSLFRRICSTTNISVVSKLSNFTTKCIPYELKTTKVPMHGTCSYFIQQHIVFPLKCNFLPYVSSYGLACSLVRSLAFAHINFTNYIFWNSFPFLSFLSCIAWVLVSSHKVLRLAKRFLHNFGSYLRDEWNWFWFEIIEAYWHSMRCIHTHTHTHAHTNIKFNDKRTQLTVQWKQCVPDRWTKNIIK